LAVEPFSLAAASESEPATEPSRWWWLVVLLSSLSGWAAVISVTVWLAKLL
jgi:hypothetical protein